MKLQITIDLDRLTKSGASLDELLSRELAKDVRTGGSVVWTENGWNVGTVATVRDDVPAGPRTWKREAAGRYVSADLVIRELESWEGRGRASDRYVVVPVGDEAASNGRERFATITDAKRANR